MYREPCSSSSAALPFDERRQRELSSECTTYFPITSALFRADVSTEKKERCADSMTEYVRRKYHSPVSLRVYRAFSTLLQSTMHLLPGQKVEVGAEWR